MQPIIQGQKFNHWTAIKQVDATTRGRTTWLFRCDCGTERKFEPHFVKSGHTKSCGCWKGKLISQSRRTHGETPIRLYRIWKGIKRRCTNPHHKDFKYYGARGITICEEWSDSYESFRDWALQNGYSDTLTIDRINVDEMYSPNNCRWVDMATQTKNKRNNCYLTFNGETKTISEWSKITGLDRHTISRRKNVLKWDDEKVLTTFPKNAFKKTRDITFDKIKKLVAESEKAK